MPVAVLENIRKVYGPTEILSSASFAIEEGERVGLVGANGAGKSTLARILAGLEEADGGRIVRRRDARILYLDQAPNLEAGRSARDVVLDGLGQWRQASERFQEISRLIDEGSGDMERLTHDQAEAAADLERSGGWERVHEAEAVLGHLGIENPDAIADRMSGGERRRVALARLLVAGPDLAILDEPTNHLDIPTIEWLEDYLTRSFRGAVLLVTHDRVVLDNVVSRTLEVERGEVTSFAGGYAAFLEGKAAREAYAERVESNRQNYLRSEMEWLRRSPKARSTKQKARIQRAEAAMEESGPEAKQSAKIEGTALRSGKTVLAGRKLSVGRGEDRLITGLDFDLVAGERLGVVGPNGSGKTTFLRTLMEDIPPLGGEIVLGANTRIAYLDQERSGLDEDATIFENVAKGRGHVLVGSVSIEPAQYLERFLFDRKSQRRPVAGLSGGERARVALAKLLADPANLLLLDEPTNDLDVDTLAALESLLLEYGGSVVLVTHDRRLLDRVATRTLLLGPDEEGGATIYAGGYSSARGQSASQRRPTSGAGATDARSGGSGTGDAGSSDAAAPRNATGGKAKNTQGGPANAPGTNHTANSKKKRASLSYNERRELDGISEAIEKADAEVQRLESELANPKNYDDAERVARLAKELGDAQAAAEHLLERWEELETKAAGEA